MQIRPYGKVIQLLRSSYIDEKKRSVQKLIGSFSMYDRVLPEKVKNLLTEKELAQVNTWLDVIIKKEADQSLQYRAEPSAIINELELIAEALTVHPVNKVQTEKIKKSIKAIQKALRKSSAKP